MQCALKRFGPGVSSTRPTNTEASREIQSKLSQMMSERDKQDKMWIEDQNQNTCSKPTHETKKLSYQK